MGVNGLKYEKDLAKKLLISETNTDIKVYYTNKEKTISQQLVCPGCGNTFIKKCAIVPCPED